jgi:exonuclease SbcD
MKILHTSDWHLGKKLGSFSRLEEQEAVLEEICGIAEQEKAHAIIVAGDLFDTYNPSSDAVEVFYRHLKELAAGGRRAVIALAGNHDSPNRQSPNHCPASKPKGKWVFLYPPPLSGEQPVWIVYCIIVQLFHC